MTTYATAAQVAAKWRTLTAAEAASVEAHLEEGSALLRRLIAGLDDAIADESVDAVLVRMVLTNAVLRVMRNPSGATSQTVGPESATFAGLNARPEVTFTEAELALLLPDSDTVSVGGAVIGTAKLGVPDWASRAAETYPYGYQSESYPYGYRC